MNDLWLAGSTMDEDTAMNMQSDSDRNSGSAGDSNSESFDGSLPASKLCFYCQYIFDHWSEWLLGGYEGIHASHIARISVH